MRSVLILLLLGGAVCTAQSKTKACTPATKEHLTDWGHTALGINLRDTPLRDLRGRVVVGGERPLGGVLVEVFDYRDDTLPDLDNERPRLSACVTGPVGRFSFTLPSGRYQVRASKRDWNLTQVLIVVDRKKGMSKSIEIPLQVGT